LSEINIERCKDAAPAFLRKWRKGAVEWIIFPVNEIFKRTSLQQWHLKVGCQVNATKTASIRMAEKADGVLNTGDDIKKA
jgi:hypothetical protein